VVEVHNSLNAGKSVIEAFAGSWINGSVGVPHGERILARNGPDNAGEFTTAGAALGQYDVDILCGRAPRFSSSHHRNPRGLRRDRGANAASAHAHAVLIVTSSA
jgi:hypothetical protein